MELYQSVVCDTDGDGLPNIIDLDSDNERRVDAIEGATNLLSNVLIKAAGKVNVGNG